jgi:hypothetical protein
MTNPTPTNLRQWPKSFEEERMRMTDAEFKEERKADDAWTGPRLAVLTVVTLGIALSIIYMMASYAAPY